jgi:RNA polymerase sigma factor (sigma-70 family)
VYGETGVADHNRLINAGARVRLRLAADDRLVAFVRRGDSTAFEVLYERHSRGLLSFCLYMLGSRQDAEDAVQATFTSAYRALRADGRPVALRPWLFTIARNDCLNIMRRRRPTVELNGELALRGDPFRELELQEEVRHMLAGMRDLPESQRAALVLAELHGLSQAEIGEVLGVEPHQVKAYVYQARSNLISARRARETDCEEIREELASARGAALLRGRLRRHVRSCADCRVYADGITRQRHQLGALLPLVPSLVLKYRALEGALGIGAADPVAYAGGATVGGAVASGALEIAGGGIKALAVKMAAGAALLGASAGVGATVIGVPIVPEEQGPTTAAAAQSAQRSLAVGTGSALGSAQLGALGRSRGGKALGQGLQPSTSSTQSALTGGGSVPAAGDPRGGGPASGGTDEGRRREAAGGASNSTSVAGGQGHQNRREANASHSQERQKEGEEDQRERQGHQLQGEERQQQSRERQQQSKERQQQSEERQHARQEQQRLREQHIPLRGSGAPKSEEELRVKREKREQRLKERELERAEGK